ncbi:MAG: Signal peptidase-like protein [Rhodothermales bacterium]|nr:Signal peptidase-like protein [Rhodothermales bacterium]
MACESCGSGGTGGCSSGDCGTDACPSNQPADWLTDMGSPPESEWFPIIEVGFKGGRKAFYRCDLRDVQTGDHVLVEADRGLDLGTVKLSGQMVRIRLRSKSLEEDADFPAVARQATAQDLDRLEENRERETETFLIGRRTIDRMGLPMKLVDVEWQFDGKKVTFYFTADHRVDFRELVRKLARRFRTRVELRQIGARDEAARIGGIGSCGRELCCSTWLQEFKPVSTQSAKTQNLPLNPGRLSGQCGRLKCCLNYELEAYMAALRRFPRVDARLKTDDGSAVVRKVDIFKETVLLQMDSGSWMNLTLEQVRPYMPKRSKPGS